MSALGQKRTLAHVRVMSALPPKADIRIDRQDVCFVLKADSCGAANSSLFDHLVGNSEQRRRDRDTEPVCGFAVDDRLELGRLLDRDIGDFRAFEDKIDNLCAAPPLRAVICPVGLVTASLLKQAVLCSNPQITL